MQAIKHSQVCCTMLLAISIACGSVVIRDAVGHSNAHFRRSKAMELECPACLDARLVQHYTARQCKPIVPRHCSCPSRFQCLPPGESHAGGLINSLVAESLEKSHADGRNGSDCVHQGQHYRLGDVVPTHDLCRICICNYLPDGEIGVDCETKIECPVTRSYRSERFGRHTPYMRLVCYDFYEHNKCCPRQECMPVNGRTGRTLKPRKTCMFLNRQFQMGEKIDLLGTMNDAIAAHGEDVDADADEQHLVTEIVHTNYTSQTKIGFKSLASQLACMSCICTDAWNKTGYDYLDESTLHALKRDTVSCRVRQCQLNLDPRFRSGCIPVYSEDHCCPINYICARSRSMSMKIRGLDFRSRWCQFEGRKYLIGAKLYMNNHKAAPCVDCECRVPPEFTCLQQKNCNPMQSN